MAGGAQVGGGGTLFVGGVTGMIALLAADGSTDVNLWCERWFQGSFGGSAFLALLGLYIAASAYLPLPMLRTLEERRAATAPEAAVPEYTPDAPVFGAVAVDPARAGQWVLVEASRNDDHFPRIESAVDSFGNRAEADRADDEGSRLWTHPKRILRPGQHVFFEVDVSDPNGEDVEVRVLCGSGEAEVVIDPDGTIKWNVREENIADPAFVHIYARSQRPFHRLDTFDASANFLYRVLPRLAPKVSRDP